MKGMNGKILSRDESDLVRYYRELPLQEQLSILEDIEARFNSARRMEELAGRGRRPSLSGEDVPWH